MSDIDTTLLRALLNAVNEIKERLGDVEGARSSVEISTSPRGKDIKVKAYVGSNVREAGDAAAAEYQRLTGELETKQLTDWEDTVKGLKR